MQLEKLIDTLMVNMLKLISLSPKSTIDKFFSIVYLRLSQTSREYFWSRITDAMYKRCDSSLYAYKIFKSFFQQAKEYGIAVETGANIFELGAGKPVATGIFWKYSGANSYMSIDKFIDADFDQNLLDNVQELLKLNIDYKMNFKISELFAKKNNKLVANEKHLKFVKEDFLSYEFDEKFDYIYSNAVLEHVEDPKGTILKLKEILSDNGVMIHGIDFQEHYRPGHTGFDRTKSVEFMKYSKEEWANIEVDTYNINRLRFSDYKKLFEENGFEVIETQIAKMFSFDKSVYDEIHEDFKKYNFEDLKIAVAVFTLRKQKV